MFLRQLLLCILLIGCVSSLVFAQTNSQQDDGKAIQINTELIQLDVIVTDKKGHLVDNLKQTDFELLEDGKVQDISFFSLVTPQTTNTNQLTPNTSTSTSVNISTNTNIDKKINLDVQSIEQSGRTFVILVDDLHINPNNMSEVRKQLLKLVNTQFQQGDRFAVVSTGGGLGFLQQLTDDRLIIHRAIDKLRSQSRTAVSPGDPAMLTEFQAQKILQNDSESLNLGVMRYLQNTGLGVVGSERQGKKTAREAAERDVKATARQIVETLSFQTSATLSSIRNTILAVKSIPGRKTMILVSDGFLIEPRESTHLDQLNSIIDAATRSGVVVYSLGSSGLSPNQAFNAEERLSDGRGVSINLSSQSQVASLAPIKSIAQDTGGFSVTNSNDLLGGLQNIVKESSSYYLLAYYPESSQKNNKFREIKINIKGENQLIVKTRKGYFANSENTNLVAKKTDAPKPNDDLLNAMASVIPVKDISLKIKTDFLGDLGDAEKNNTVISLAIDLRDIEFTKSTGRYQNKVKALLLVVGEDGKIAHSSENDLDINFTQARYNQIGNSWFFFGKSLSLKPGFYNVRFAVKDPITNKLGNINSSVEVLDTEKSKLQLSNILLLHDGDPANTASTNINGQGQALSVFSEKSSIGFLFYIFNGSKLKTSPELTAQIQILQGNKALFSSQQLNITEKADKTGRIIYGGQLPLTGFLTGQYQLKVTVSDSKNNVQASQEQDFTIEK